MSARGSARRRLCAGVFAVLALASAGSAASAQAAGNTYNVFKCHEWATSADELEEAGSHSSYERIEQCRPQSSELMFGITNTGAASNNAYEQYMYSAPPATRIVRACMQYRLRRQNHHRAEIFAYPGFTPLAFGGDEPSGWSPVQCFDLNHQQLIVRLSCSNTGDCPAAPNAHALVRNLVLFLSDEADPVMTVGGSLFGGGWMRGDAAIEARASDQGAGAFHLVAYANGVELARSDSACSTGGLGWPSAVRLIPCDQSILGLNLSLDTARAPFVNGENQVSVYVADFAGNVREERRSALIDNQAPSGHFAPQDGDDPELIRVALADAHSGIAEARIEYRRAGTELWMPLDTTLGAEEATARVDSAAVPAGEYEFRAQLEDHAGNVGVVDRREDGSETRLQFPLRQPSLIRARVGTASGNEVVPYGTPSQVRGRLVDGSGEPLVETDVVVTEFFGDGALIRTRPTRVVTDETGRFRSKIPAGPSREIVVAYAGSRQLLPSKRRAGSLLVRSKTSLRTSAPAVREGERLVFKGRVHHFGARIPKGGKLIELQVQVRKHQWDTVREAFRTNDRGGFRLGYRFGRHYEADARFTFRVKIQGESDWPFERATSTHREVTVEAR